MSQGQLPPENSIDDVRIRIKESYKNANVGKITQAFLKEGPQAYKLATLLEIKNPATDEFHHYSLKIDHVDKRKSGWSYKAEKSVRLEGSAPDEIEKLYKFLQAAYDRGIDAGTGEHHLITSSDYAKLENVIDFIPSISDTDKLNLVGKLVSQIDDHHASTALFVEALSGSRTKVVRSVAAASRLIEYSKGLDDLKELVFNPQTKEGEFQAHLEVHPWMFGSEYSELLSRKTWTRDDKLDYMLRKTVDDYLEIIEIKTAFDESLFLHDGSHDSYYPSSKLSPVLGQVTRYIEEVERNRDSILAKDGFDTLKIRARVIVGRDGSHEHQTALRNFNAHLHRIEILTYDQLIRIAERVISVFDDVPPWDQFDGDPDEIPF